MKKPWYKKWWGILLIIIFFPIGIPYLVWTKTTWKKGIKIAITVVCILLFFMFQGVNKQMELNQAALEETQKNEQQEKLSQLKTSIDGLINENKITEALPLIEEAKALDSKAEGNFAYLMDKDVKSLQSDEFLNTTLLDMSDADFELFKKGELTTAYLKTDSLNKLFVQKLQDNIYLRDLLLEEKVAKERTDLIELSFSAWDGSHNGLTELIKDSMNDPKSYEHVETRYIDKGDYLIIMTTFRGTNGFGAIIKNTVTANVSLTGEVLEIISQE